MSWLFSVALKAGLLLAASGVVALLMRRSAAAARHRIWTLGVLGALVVPIFCWTLSSDSLPPEVKTIAPARAWQEAATVAVAAHPAPAWPSWLGLVWAAGTLLVSLRFARAHLAARRLARRAEPWRDVYLGPVVSPLTVGVWRPRVILPAAAGGWSPERLRAVLTHERGHVRRRDNLVQLGAQLTCALYWWNPLAWLAASRLRVERERACDDLVLAAGVRPSSYAADLLDLARGPALAGAASMIDDGGTEGRLRRILDPETPRQTPGPGFRLTALGIAAAVAVTIGVTSSPPPVAAAARNHVWIGAPRLITDVPPLLAEDAIDVSKISAAFEARAGELERCYARRLKVRPKLVGTVVVHRRLVAGSVFEPILVSNTLQDPELEACVLKAAREVQLPVAEGAPIQVQLPVSFGPKRPDGC